MMNKKTEELKRSRRTLEYENKLSSPTVKELSEECKGVSIDVELTFISAFGRSDKVYNVILTSADKAYFHRDCLNNDCTGSGFSLSNEIREAIRSRKTKEGVIRCDGKEDWKYMNNVGNSCMSTCKYRIEPHF